jgi:FlaA1/EpsC-like NDP-sugar epimerase
MICWDGIPWYTDTAGLKSWITNHVVLVSGAGGSIGSELCRQIAKYQPRQLILLELNEFALYTIEQEFARAIPTAKYRVRNRRCEKRHAPWTKLLKTLSPVDDLSCGSVQACASDGNAEHMEAVLNNVLGTRVLAQAAITSGVENLLFISTDKAVNPTNVMGASKRLAEMVCQSLQQGSEMQFVMVRFGTCSARPAV